MIADKRQHRDQHGEELVDGGELLVAELRTGQHVMFGKSSPSARSIDRRAASCSPGFARHEHHGVLGGAGTDVDDAVGDDDGYRLAEDADEVLVAVDAAHVERERAARQPQRDGVAGGHVVALATVVVDEDPVLGEAGGAPAHDAEVDHLAQAGRVHAPDGLERRPSHRADARRRTASARRRRAREAARSRSATSPEKPAKPSAFTT